MSVSYKVNLPVLLQDPMGSEENVSPLVGVHMNTSTHQGRSAQLGEYFCVNTHPKTL